MRYFYVCLMITSTFICTEVKAQNLSNDSIKVKVNKKVLRILNKMNYELNLSTDQIKQLRVLLIDRHDQIVKIEQKIANKDEEIESINLDSFNTLSQILTDDQLDKYLSLRQFLSEKRQKEGVPKKLDPLTDF